MKSSFKPLFRTLLMLALTACGTAHAQLALQGTRVIYPSERKEVSVALTNMGEAPVLVQAWVADGGAEQSPEASQAPFVLAPPLFRLDPGKGNYLRIRQIPGRMPADDREHMYWLDVLGVPAADKQADGGDESKLNVIVRSRYKLLYRPEGLKVPVDPAQSLSLSISTDMPRVLVLRNNSAFYVNLGRLSVTQGGGAVELPNPAVPPRDEVRIVLPDAVRDAPRTATFSWVDDDGMLHEVAREL